MATLHSGLSDRPQTLDVHYVPFKMKRTIKHAHDFPLEAVSRGHFLALVPCFSRNQERFV